MTAFQIDTKPTKTLLVENLTRDASTQACIFDLVDNSIDAARNQILASRSSEEKSAGLPESYDNYHAHLTISHEEISISDNCGGMDSEGLAQGYLRFGKTSSHEYGIGLYGVGLNRALFKLGNDISITTTDSSATAKVKIDRAAYIADEDNWGISGNRLKKSADEGTIIAVKSLDSSISSQAADDVWKDKLEAEISVRYARFIDKGFSIRVNGREIRSSLVQVRTSGPFPVQRKTYKFDDDTTIDFISGQHEFHRFTAETDYDKTRNHQISNQFGWSIICNDRVIVNLDTSPKTGWDKKWHNEFNGFVGFVHFRSKKPGKLPWNTQKTDIDLNNPAYIAALDDMKAFTDHWRKNSIFAKKQRKANQPLLAPTPKPTSTQPLPSPQPSNPSPVSSTPKPPPPASQTPTVPNSPSAGKGTHTKKPPQTQLRFVLPEDIDEKHLTDKALALVQEAQKLDIFECHYSALALIRMLFECSGRIYLIRKSNYQNAIDKVIAERNRIRAKQGRTALSATEAKNANPSIDELVWLFENDASLWSDGEGPHMKVCLGKFAKSKERLNSAVHQPFQVINMHEALTIRDEAIPLLRHLIEK